MQRSREGLYDLLPAVIRQRDQANGKALEQLLAIIDGQALEIEHDLDRMLDNWFIETCENWVVPYIGDLLGYELPSGATAQGASLEALERVLVSRREVGNLVAQRRRKGTAVVLEAIARDITGWPASAVEYYQRLVVAQHLDHLRPERPATLDLRALDEKANSAFDTACGLVDVHRIGNASSPGRFNITSVGLHVYRLRRHSVTRTPAYLREDQGDHCYTFSVLGNDVPLVRQPRSVPEVPQAADIDDIPLPIGRFDLKTATTPIEADPRLYGPDRSFSIVVPHWPKKGQGFDIPASVILPADLSHWSCKVPKGRIAVDPVRGRIMFNERQPPANDVTVTVSYGYGAAMDLGGGEYPRELPPMPATLERLVVRTDGTTPLPGEFPTLAAAVADWQRRRVAAATSGTPVAEALRVELVDSGVYGGGLDLALQAGESVWIVASPGKRPVLWLSDSNAGRSEAISVRGGRGSRFTLDGIMVAGRGIEVAPLSHDDLDNPAPSDADLCQVLIRHCTLVPGWTLENDCTPCRTGEPSIVLNGSRTCLSVSHSIVGAIRVISDAGIVERARILIEGSIVDATATSRNAIAGPVDEVAAAELCIQRSTVVGKVRVHAVTLVNNTILAGTMMVARRQRGCVRYSYLPPGSRTPRRHHCQPDASATPVEMLRIHPGFMSMRFGTPDYMRLHADVPDEIRRGADDTSEMGVYHDLFEPQRIALLEARLADAVPAGIEASVRLEN
jgi:hypothetical protein